MRAGSRTCSSTFRRPRSQSACSPPAPRVDRLLRVVLGAGTWAVAVGLVAWAVSLGADAWAPRGAAWLTAWRRRSSPCRSRWAHAVWPTWSCRGGTPMRCNPWSPWATGSRPPSIRGASPRRSPRGSRAPWACGTPVCRARTVWLRSPARSATRSRPGSRSPTPERNSANSSSPRVPARRSSRRPIASCSPRSAPRRHPP